MLATSFSTPVCELAALEAEERTTSIAEAAEAADAAHATEDDVEDEATLEEAAAPSGSRQL
jgi:hypothetical protein